MGECTSEYEELERQRKAISERITEASNLAKDQSLSSHERNRQAIRARELRKMYNNISEQMKCIHHTDENEKPKRKHRASTGSHTSVGVMDILLRSGALWSDLEGHTWGSYAGLTWSLHSINGETLPNGRAVKRLLQYVRDGIENCTEKQKNLIIKYYTTDLNVTELAKEIGVNKSTVSRILHRGLDHVSLFVTAKLLIPRCIDKNNKFNYFLFLNSITLLTERQKELAFLFLTDGGITFEELADYLKVDKSTISRTAARLDYRFNSIALELSPELSNIRIDRESWKGITEKTLAENMGLSRYFFYNILCKKDTYQGIRASHYFILQCYQRDVELYPNDRVRDRYERLSFYLGCSKYTISHIRTKYRREIIDLTEEVEEYTPKPQKVYPPIKNPLQAVYSDEKTTLLDLMSSETYIKLMKLAERTNHADS